MKNCKPLPVILLLCLLFLQQTFAFDTDKAPKHSPPKDEIIYHVFLRSFYDSDGDGHGDLNGLCLKLDYLQQLGVTAIQLTPLYESIYYHNYFATDFFKIDPRYGTMDDYLRLVKEIHRRGMKIYLDMETQYVASDHIWFRDSYKNPSSKYSDYIFYTDKSNTNPVSIVAGITDFTGYDGVTRKLVMVNLDNKAVQDYNYRLFKFFMDPNGDGKFDDGVDGFRLDHMMDNLDNLNRLPHLFTTFWNPLITKLHKVNPNIKIVAEQANWISYGIDYLEKTKIDRVFDFMVAFAIRDMKKNELEKLADSTFLRTPKGKQQVVFIENHDMPRFASVEKSDPGKLRIGCVLNLLMGGIPAIYYGQELGQTGEHGNWGIGDGNDIPDRQAFEWYKTDQGPGMAYWYKNGPWWTKSNTDIPNDGVSLEEEKNDPNSLWNYYRAVIRLRSQYPVIINGGYEKLVNGNDKVFAFERFSGNEKVIVAVNLSGKEQQTDLAVDAKALNTVFGNAKADNSNGKMALSMPAYGVGVWEVR
jgi:alpha-amylase